MEVEDKVEDKVEDENKEEGRKPRVPRRPTAPTKAEIEDHMPLHFPPRDWCPHCVAGHGISHQHRRATGDTESLGVTVSMDYCFMRKEEQEEGVSPILAMYDNDKGMIWILGVEHKGVDETVVKWALEKLEEAGYKGTKITLKSDQEEAILALKRAIAAKRTAETAMIESPVRESKSNGQMERMIRAWRAQMRTVKDHLEARLKERLRRDNPLIHWLNAWAGEILNKYRVGPNGRTPYELATGHRCRHFVVGFAEKVLFKMTTDKTKRDRSETEWSTGYFLGVISRTTEFLIGTPEGIIKCTTIKRVPDDQAYDRACLEVMKTTYYQYLKDGASSTTGRCRYADPMPKNPDPRPITPSRGGYAPRRMRMGPETLGKYGHTVGCKGCEAVEMKLGYRRVHNEECYARITKAMEDEEGEGREKVQRARDRTTEHLAKEVKRSEEEQAAPEEGEVQVDQEMMQAQGEIVSEDQSTPSTTAMDTEVEAHGEDRKRGGDDEGRRNEAADKRARHKPPGLEAREKRKSDEMSDGPATKVTRVESADQQMAAGDDGDCDGTGDVDDNPMVGIMDHADRKILSAVIRGVDITEVYSPERVGKVWRKYGLMTGQAMDLLTGYDFTKEADRRRAWKEVKENKPFLLIGSPPCTLFSILQEMNWSKYGTTPGWKTKFEERLKEAEEHIRFCCRLYRHQLQEGRHFLHEHPWSARSWKMECIEDLIKDSRVSITRTDMCRFGMKAVGPDDGGKEGPVKKPTGFMGTSWCVAEELGKTCRGDHTHVQLMGARRAAKAAVYPDELCDAIAKGVIRQKTLDERGTRSSPTLGRNELKSMIKKMCGRDKMAMSLIQNFQGGVKPRGEWPKEWVDVGHEDDRVPQVSALVREGKTGVEYAVDDVTGVPLDPDLVLKARNVEMHFFKKMNVYTIVDASHQKMNGGKIIDVRWIDTNKGDSMNPDIRSRLVGREFNNMRDDSLYAATPPIEALRLVLSDAATMDPKEPRKRKEVMINDVRRAYFYAKTTRDLYIRLPKEDKDADEGKLGKLNLCLYGTRDAAKGWQDELSGHLLKIGFERGRGFPSVFHHSARGIKTLVHGDDYFSSGHREHLDWLQCELEKQYDLKTQRVGVGNDRSKEGKVLNRIVRATAEGFELEADPRHAELIIEQLGIKDERMIGTPGVEGKEEEDEATDVPLEGETARDFRMVAARCNYLSLDRPDIQFAVKESCRDMSSPTTGSLRRLKRIGKYLQGKPRAVWMFKLQEDTGCLDVSTDANWAGCRKSRKSTSGGTIMRGSHCIKTWAKTQAVIAKSSAESELYAVVRGGCESLGMITLMKDFGVDIKVRIHIDSNAAKGILERTGLHKIRHLDVDMLWMQGQVAKEILEVKKIKGEENTADLMTKHVGKAVMEKHMVEMGVIFCEGRAEKAAQLHACIEAGDHKGSGDCWSERGKNGKWIRIHKTPRRSLFTPFKVAKGPKIQDKLATVRLTNGKFENGETFSIVDGWMDLKLAHRCLKAEWTGQTMFLKGSD